METCRIIKIKIIYIITAIALLHAPACRKNEDSLGHQGHKNTLNRYSTHNDPALGAIIDYLTCELRRDNKGMLNLLAAGSRSRFITQSGGEDSALKYMKIASPILLTEYRGQLLEGGLVHVENREIMTDLPVSEKYLISYWEEQDQVTDIKSFSVKFKIGSQAIYVGLENGGYKILFPPTD